MYFQANFHIVLRWTDKTKSRTSGFLVEKSNYVGFEIQPGWIYLDIVSGSRNIVQKTEHTKVIKCRGEKLWCDFRICFSLLLNL